MSLSNREVMNPENIEQEIKRNRYITAIVKAFEHFDIAIVFAHFSRDSWHLILESVSKFFLFAFAAAASLYTAGRAWRELWLTHNKTNYFSNRLFIHAMVETVAAFAITAAVVGGLAFSAIFVLASPYIFAIVLGAKSVYHLAAGLVELGYAAFGDKAERKDCLQRAMDHGVSAVVSAGISAGVTLVMILAKPAFAPIGYVSCVIGGLYSLYKAIQNARALRLANAEATTTNEEPTRPEANPELAHDNALGASLESRLTGLAQQSDKTNLIEADVSAPLPTTPPNTPELIVEEVETNAAQFVESVVSVKKFSHFAEYIPSAKASETAEPDQSARMIASLA